LSTLRFSWRRFLNVYKDVTGVFSHSKPMTINLFKNGQSLDLLVSPLKLIMSLMVSKQRKKRNIKMIFFKTILIQLPCNPFKYIFVHMRQKKTFKVLSFVWCKNIVCCDLALQDTMTKRAKKNITRKLL
jgi:hypothetical protein